MMINDIVSVLDKWVDRRLEGVHTSMPAKIISYEFSSRKATVLPLVNLRMASGDLLEMPAIDAVPVMFPCSHGWSLIGPIKEGDLGLLLVTESSLGNWLNGQGQQVDPEDETRFSLQDAVFLPGMYPFSAIPSQPGAENELALATPNGSLIIREDGSIAVEAQGKVSITNQASGLQAELGKLWDAINDVLAQYKNMVTTNAVVGSPCALLPANKLLVDNSISANNTSKSNLSQFLED